MIQPQPPSRVPRRSLPSSRAGSEASPERPSPRLTSQRGPPSRHDLVQQLSPSQSNSSSRAGLEQPTQGTSPQRSILSRPADLVVPESPVRSVVKPFHVSWSHDLDRSSERTWKRVDLDYAMRHELESRAIATAASIMTSSRWPSTAQTSTGGENKAEVRFSLSSTSSNLSYYQIICYCADQILQQFSNSKIIATTKRITEPSVISFAACFPITLVSLFLFKICARECMLNYYSSRRYQRCSSSQTMTSSSHRTMLCEADG